MKLLKDLKRLGGLEIITVVEEQFLQKKKGTVIHFWLKKSFFNFLIKEKRTTIRVKYLKVAKLELAGLSLR